MPLLTSTAPVVAMVSGEAKLPDMPRVTPVLIVVPLIVDTIPRSPVVQAAHFVTEQSSAVADAEDNLP